MILRKQTLRSWRKIHKKPEEYLNGVCEVSRPHPTDPEGPGARGDTNISQQWHRIRYISGKWEEKIASHFLYTEYAEGNAVLSTLLHYGTKI